MKTAKLIKVMDDFKSEASLYELNPPLSFHKGLGYGIVYHKYVIVSAVVTWDGPETYIFPATRGGEVVDWMELPGSFRGLSHEEALKGYKIIK